MHDLFLAKPLSDRFMEALLFGTFSVHLLFVLLMLGTAILAVVFYIRALYTDSEPQLHWDKRLLRVHLGVKSLAVVLGVAPLLIIQVMWGVPFLTATSILGPYWLGLIGLLVFAFLLLDMVELRITTLPLPRLFAAVLGLAALLCAPAVFTAVVSLLEHPDKWALVAQKGFAADPALLAHWLLRYLHILGAAIVFGAAFHAYRSIRNANEDGQYRLSRWVFMGTLFQVLVGVLLLYSLRDRLTPTIMAVLGLGVLAVLALLAATYARERPGFGRFTMSLALLPVILAFMLLGRQMLQHEVVAPVQAGLAANAAVEIKRMTPYSRAASEAYAEQLATVYDNGKTIYARSCAFCHGQAGDGQGAEAAALIVPPEQLAAVRADREYLYILLRDGVDGSAMPYFSVFDRPKLDSLLEYLQDTFAATDMPQPAQQPVDMAAADLTFQNTCTVCHGSDGRISAFGEGLRPPPPDLTRYALSPQRSFDVITNGYDGTVMQPFNALPEATRWGLVRKVASLRKP